MVVTASRETEAIETVVRIEFPRIVAGVARIVGDVGIAEELAQDALVVALERWPESGVPDNPGAWLMATAKHRAIDLVRRKETSPASSPRWAGHWTTCRLPSRRTRADIDDDLLRLMFTACHPVLSPEARVALTLRLLGGLTTEEIARAFLVPESTVAQRIVRAKRALAEARRALRGPGRTRAVGSPLVGARGHLPHLQRGLLGHHRGRLVRPALCEDALRLARVLEGLMPDEPEVHGLAALLELQASRVAARTGPDGEPVLLADQDRSRWNRMLIRRGLEALAPGAGDGPYSLQAAIAACHARARSLRGDRLDGHRRAVRPADGPGPRHRWWS